MSLYLQFHLINQSKIPISKCSPVKQTIPNLSNSIFTNNLAISEPRSWDFWRGKEEFTNLIAYLNNKEKLNLKLHSQFKITQYKHEKTTKTFRKQIIRSLKSKEKTQKMEIIKINLEREKGTYRRDFKTFFSFKQQPCKSTIQQICSIFWGIGGESKL